MRRKKVLVWRVGGVGDTVLLIPVLRALRRHFPRSHIVVVGNPEPLSLAIPPADEVRSADEALWATLFSRPSDELKDCLKNFELAVVYTEDEVLVRNLEGIVGRVVCWPPLPGDETHEAEHLLKALQALGIRDEDPTPRIEAYKDLELKGKVLAVHPGSGSPEKNWPPDRFAELILWAEELGVSPLLICGPADRVAVEAVVDALGRWVPIAKDLSLREVAGLLARCSAFVGNDSGIAHIAAAVGTPTVVIFGPTEPKVWAPVGKDVRVVRASSGRTEDVPLQEVQEALFRMDRALPPSTSSLSRPSRTSETNSKV